MITCLCVRNFLNAEKPFTAEAISRELEVPIRLVRSVLAELTEARLVSEVCLDQREDIAYQPACDIDRLSIAAIMERLDQHGTDTLPIAESSQLNTIRETLRRFREMNAQSPANIKLQELCAEARAKEVVA